MSRHQQDGDYEHDLEHDHDCQLRTAGNSGEHSHSHSHCDSHSGHCHGHFATPDTNYGVIFLIGILLNVGFVAIESTVGFFVDSLALIADAGHNLSDVLGLILSWVGFSLGKLAPTSRRTFGWGSASILAAFLNAILLLIAITAIAYHAIERFASPTETLPVPIMVVAGIGVFINGFTAILFHRDQHHDLNMRGAYLHMAADAGISLAVVFGGLGIWWLGWNWLDPVLSLIVAGVILVGTWELLVESTQMLTHGVPQSARSADARKLLESADGVTLLESFHVWSLSTTKVALIAQLQVARETDRDYLLRKLTTDLSRIGFDHITIQMRESTTLVGN